MCYPLSSPGGQELRGNNCELYGAYSTYGRILDNLYTSCVVRSTQVPGMRPAHGARSTPEGTRTRARVRRFAVPAAIGAFAIRWCRGRRGGAPRAAPARAACPPRWLVRGWARRLYTHTHTHTHSRQSVSERAEQPTQQRPTRMPWEFQEVTGTGSRDESLHTCDVLVATIPKRETHDVLK